MRVIPVMDLMGGVVVRGIAGRRHEYRPVQSHFAADARPETIATALVEQFGFRQAYVADLDAIAGESPAWSVYESIARCGLRLLVDAGISDLQRAHQLVESRPPLDGIIVGLESLSNPTLLRELTDRIGRQRLIFSLDLKNGAPITRCDGWTSVPPDEIARQAHALGVRRMIVLDLAHVGAFEGLGTESLCRRLASRHRDLEIISGGGVRSIEDVRLLQAAGCSAVLVASALHDGRISSTQIRELR
jgi:phosphoribosylformimino-5-aminoimidazole carboxamide ribotide isomerase